MTRRIQTLIWILLVATSSPAAAQAAPLDGAALAWPWALPFVGILLTIAIAPLVTPRFWQNNYDKLAFVWAALAVVPLAALFGVPTALAALTHTMLAEYMSFIVLLFALYVVAGGILVTGNLRGTPVTNTALLALGTVIASLVGTTGAALILIRPLIRANAARLHNAHVFVFFIFLAANIGGSLTPLGNPPLFVGFLHGIDFFWTAQHLLKPTVVTASLVLLIFVIVETRLYLKDRRIRLVGEIEPPLALRLRGGINFLLMGAIVGAILTSAVWQPNMHFDVYGTTLELQNLTRDAALMFIAVLSLALTPNEHREANGFTWEPIVEVAILFAGIFVCVIPVVAMLQAGPAGAFSWAAAATTASDGTPRDAAYFWLSGMLSAALDNAPTFLVFFELAGGDPTALMGPLANTLAAISMGAAYMGALTYIGNAPNLMIYAIASERGVKMPSFFGYILWSGVVLLPVFLLITFLFVLPP